MRFLRTVHTARSIIFSNFGAPREVLKATSHVIPNPKHDEVVLKLLCAPLNPSDINQIEGVYPSKPVFRNQFGVNDEVAVPGNEGVFEVIERGNGSNFQVGDWVLPKPSCFGTWTTHKLAKAGDLISLGKPNNLKINEAATLSVNASTAFRLLSDFQKLEKGDWFIQNGGNSGVARIAIQLGKLWGLNSINVVRDRKDIQELKQELHELGCNHVLTEEQINDRSVKTVIQEWTNKNLPKLGLNCVGGKSCTNLARQLAPNGQLVTFGGMSKQPVSLPTSLFIFKNLISRGFWVTKWNKEHFEERVAMISTLAALFRAGKLRESSGVNNYFEGTSENSDKFLDLVLNSLSKEGKQFLTVADN